MTEYSKCLFLKMTHRVASVPRVAATALSSGRTHHLSASLPASVTKRFRGNPFFLLAGSLADACPLRARVNARSRIQERGFRGPGSQWPSSGVRGRSSQSVSQLFHGPAPRSPLHRLAVRLRHSRSNTSTEYSLPGATQLSQVRSISPSGQGVPCRFLRAVLLAP